MGIKVSYSPPAAVIGGASYAAGYGDFLQRQQAVALQQQELAQRDLAQRRALAAQQQAQMFGAQQDAMQRQAQAGMFAAEQQARMQQLGMQRQWNLEDQAAQGFQQSEDDRRAFIAAQYKSGAWKLDAASTMKLNELRNNMTAVRTDPKWAPQDKSRKLAELDAQWWDIMGNPPPPLPGEEEVPWSEEVKGMTTMEPVQAPDGTFMGYNHITKTMRNGEVTPQVKFVPYKADAAQDKAQLAREVAAEKARLAQIANQQKMDAAQVEMYDQQKMEIAKLRMKLSTEMVPDTNKDGSVNMAPSADPNSAPQPKQRLRSPEEVDAIVGPLEARLQMPNLIERHFRNPPQAAPSDGIQPIIDEQIAALAPQQAPAPQPVAQPPVPQQGVPMQTPQGPPQWQQPAGPTAPPNVAAQPRDAMPPGPPGQPRIFTPEQVQGMPTVSSPEEAAQLPKGTLFVTPDGVVMEA